MASPVFWTARLSRAGLEAIEGSAIDAGLAKYQPLWAARAELLARTGAHDEALRAYGVAIGLEWDDSVRRFLDRLRSTLPR